MNNNKDTYSKIKIFKNDYDDNFLLLYNNKTLSVGYIVVEILNNLKNGICFSNIIQSNIKEKNNILLEIRDIEDTKKSIDSFLSKSSESFFYRIYKFKISKHNINLNFLFKTHIFYFLLVFFLLINLYLFKTINYTSVTNSLDFILFAGLLFFILYIHEIGHCASSKKYGVICQEMGLGIYVIFPILYTNLGEAWRLHKRKRVMINLSGIYFQLIIGGLIGLVSLFVYSKVFIFLFFSNLTIVFLNLNPFLKLDGYWLISDLLNIKNLSRKSNNLINSIIFLKINNIKKSWLLVYSILKIVFFSYVFFLIMTLLFSLLYKIYYAYPFKFLILIIFVF